MKTQQGDDIIKLVISIDEKDEDPGILRKYKSKKMSGFSNKSTNEGTYLQKGEKIGFTELSFTFLFGFFDIGKFLISLNVKTRKMFGERGANVF